MREIKAEYDRIEQAKSQIGGLALRSRKHKKTREWHVLGAVRQLLVRASSDAPTFAQEDEHPDFHTYLPDGRPWAPIEVVEVLRSDYKLQAFCRRRRDELAGAPKFYDVPPSLERPWQPLREQIHRKAIKNYSNDTCLVTYYDIGRMSFDDWYTPFQEQLLTEHAKKPFTGLNAFGQVLVLSWDMQCLVQLHPDPVTLAPV